MTGPRVLVTGAAGFVGTAVAAALVPDQPRQVPWYELFARAARQGDKSR